MTNQIRRSYKNDQSTISWLYYCVSWKYTQKVKVKLFSLPELPKKGLRSKRRFFRRFR